MIKESTDDELPPILPIHFPPEDPDNSTGLGILQLLQAIL